MSEGLNSRERVLRLFQGQQIDRIPVFSGMGNATIHGLEQHGWRFPEIHRDAHKMAAAAASTSQLFGFECAVVPFDVAVEAEALGCKVNYYSDQTDILYPTISQKLAAKVQDLDIRMPTDLAKAGRIPIVVDAIRHLKQDVGDKVAVGAWVLGPFTLAGQVVELDNLFRMSFKEPELVRRTLDVLDEIIISLAQTYRKAGADYLTVREMGATEDSISPHIFRSSIRPHLERIFTAIESPKVLHICGETNTIVEEMARCGANAISVDQKNRLSESRAKVGADTLLFGNLDPYNVLANGNIEQIENAVKNIIASGVDAVWPGCDIWPIVPRQNMETLIAATHKYGNKPRQH